VWAHCTVGLIGLCSPERVQVRLRQFRLLEKFNFSVLNAFRFVYRAVQVKEKFNLFCP
jgi:hypothetical protein